MSMLIFNASNTDIMHQKTYSLKLKNLANNCDLDVGWKKI